MFPTAQDEEVALPLGGVRLAGNLSVPARARGVVVFAHGSGSSRHSPRNAHVADFLNEAGLGTLLFDLLTPAEEQDRANVFDIPLLGERLTEVSQWVRSHTGPASKIGYFGASTGAGAALWATGQQSDIAAVVSRGGRPDLATDRLPMVKAPTLLIVGGRDLTVETLNREAQSRLRAESRLEIVPGATHLFEEPGALDEVARLAREWFLDHIEDRPDEEAGR